MPTFCSNCGKVSDLPLGQIRWVDCSGHSSGNSNSQVSSKLDVILSQEVTKDTKIDSTTYTSNMPSQDYVQAENYSTKN